MTALRSISDLRGMSFASGVSDQRGTISRFGETVITVPVTVPADRHYSVMRSDLATERS